MDSEHFLRVMSVFQEACDLDEAARRDYLDRACSGNSALRSEIEAMLAADAKPIQPVDFAGAGAHLLAAHIARDDAQAQSGGAEHAEGTSAVLSAPSLVDSAVGRGGLFAGQYRILRLLGEGGMGTVYEAEQTRPRRIVALKLIRQGLHSSSSLRRFEHEAHILGRLHHPGIAHIYEAGYAEGPHGRQAYIAMEYVAGVPLTEYARLNNLTTAQRLALMQKVCDAMQHAHQRGVIHRDLKPGNILVAAEGTTSRRGGPDDARSADSSRPPSTSGDSISPTPKILDFGVARALDGDHPMTTMHTLSGQIVGTLAYMSPEQVLADPDEIDVRSDTYALGVILYQLLTGKMPYDLRAKSIPEAAMMIRDEVAPSLSSHDAGFRGDIETIVAKALQKDRERRYQSAAELGEDIRRHLAGEPIGAKRDSALYVLRMQLRRYRMFVGAAALFGFLIAGSAVWLSVLYGQQRQLLVEVESQRDKAIDASRLAGERAQEATAARDRSERSAMRSESVKAFLQQMLSAADPMLALGPEVTVRDMLDEAARRMDAGSFTDQPDIEAETRLTIGMAYRRLGRFDESRRQLQNALAINQNLHPGDHPYVADSLSQLAELARVEGRLDAADALSHRSIEMFRRVGGVSRAMGLALNTRGMLMMSRAEYNNAEALFKECIDIWSSAHGEKSIDVAGVKQNLAAIYLEVGRKDEAKALIEDSIALFGESVGSEHPYVALGLNNLGALAFANQDFDSATEMLTETLRIYRKFFGDESQETAGALINVAVLHETRQAQDEAETCYQQALAIQRKVLSAEHPEIAKTLSRLGLMLQRRGRVDEAEAAYREALDIFEEAFGRDHPDVATSLSNLASILHDRGELVMAERMHREALEIRRNRLPAGHRDTSSSLGMLAGLMLQQERFEDAEPLARECLEIRERTAPDHWLCASASVRMALVLGGQKRFEEAMPYALRGWDILETSPFAPAEYRIEAAETLVKLCEARGLAEEEKVWRDKLTELQSAQSASSGEERE